MIIKLVIFFLVIGLFLFIFLFSAAMRILLWIGKKLGLIQDIGPDTAEKQRRTYKENPFYNEQARQKKEKSNPSPAQKQKIFAADEGEYVEFEEIQ